jgi:N-terminal half of MaoC dehydratase
MVDKASIGAKGEPFELVIERGKVREMARAVGSSHPSYVRSATPPIPPTFLTTMFFWEREVPGSNPWEKVKLDQARGMHAEQEYIFHGPPPRAGTRLLCQSRIEDVYEKEGRRGGKLGFAVMVTEFRDESGRLVAEARMTGVETARPPESEAKP